MASRSHHGDHIAPNAPSHPSVSRTICELEIFVQHESLVPFIHPNLELLEHFAQQASDTVYQPVIGICGPTNCGKSKLTQTLLCQSLVGANEHPQLNGWNADGQNTRSQTGDINFYWGEIMSHPPFMLLDTEGQFAFGSPNEVTKRNWFSEKIAKLVQVTKEALSSEAPTYESVRTKAVDKLYPQLIYAVCDIVIYVTNKSLKDSTTVDNILEFAIAGSNVKGRRPPHLIIVRNFATVVETQEPACKDDPTAYYHVLLDTYRKDNGETYLKQLLEYFSSVRVALIPQILKKPPALASSGEDFVNEEEMFTPWPATEPLPHGHPRIKQLLRMLSEDLTGCNQSNHVKLTGREWFTSFHLVAGNLKGRDLVDMDEISAQRLSVHEMESAATNIVNAGLEGLSSSGKQLPMQLYTNMRIAGLGYLASVTAHLLYVEKGVRFTDEKTLSDPYVNSITAAFNNYWSYTARRRPCTSTCKKLLKTLHCCSESGTHYDTHFSSENFGALNWLFSRRWKGTQLDSPKFAINELDSSALQSSQLRSVHEPSDCFELEALPVDVRREAFVKLVVQHIQESTAQKTWNYSKSFKCCTNFIGHIQKLRKSVGCGPLKSLELQHGCYICGSIRQDLSHNCHCNLCEECSLTAAPIGVSPQSCIIHNVPLCGGSKLPMHLTVRPPKNCGVRALANDGGGVRGLSSAIILRDIELRIQSHLGTDQIKLRDLFDIVVGTSTGSLLTAAIVKGIPMQEVVDLYKRLSEKIFWTKSKLKLFFYNATSGQNLQAELEKLLKQRQNSLLLPYWGAVCTSIDGNKKQSTLICGNIRSHNSDGVHEQDDRRYIITSLEIAPLRSSAAPIYFKAHFVNGEKVVDGGLRENNPVLTVVDVADMCFPASSIATRVIPGVYVQYCFEHLGRLDTVVSIGTGEHTPASHSASFVAGDSSDLESMVASLFGAVDAAFKSACDTTTAHKAMLAKVAPDSGARNTSYQRVNVPYTEFFDFADSSESNLKNIERETSNHLLQVETSQKIFTICGISLASLFYANVTASSNSLTCQIYVHLRVEIVEPRVLENFIASSHIEGFISSFLNEGTVQQQANPAVQTLAGVKETVVGSSPYYWKFSFELQRNKTYDISLKYQSPFQASTLYEISGCPIRIQTEG